MPTTPAVALSPGRDVLRQRPLDNEKSLPVIFATENDPLAEAPAAARPITVPQFQMVPEADLELISQRRFRRPVGLIKLPSTRPQRIECEMDDEDEAWLALRHAPRQRHPPMELDHFEETMDGFERESFRVLHQQGLIQQRTRALAVHRRTAHAAIKAPKHMRKPGKPEKPPPPTDEELASLPQGLCVRFQQAHRPPHSRG
jgi:hypothetical protein